MRLAEKITTDLLPFYGAGLAGRFDDIRPQDRAQQLAELRLARGVLTVDELRARYFGLGPLPAPAKAGAEACEGTPAPEPAE